MLSDQKVKLFKLRLHDVDVSEIEIHYLDQKRCFCMQVSAPGARDFGALPARFCLVLLVPFFLFCRQQCQDVVERACSLFSGFVCRVRCTFGGMPLLASPSAMSRLDRLGKPCHFLEASNICSGVIIALAAHQVPEYAFPKELPTRCRSVLFNSAPLPCKVKQVSRVLHTWQSF